MSKSYGNFYTLRDLLDKGHNPLAIRWALLATHYRQPNNFTFETLDAATQSLARIRDFRLRLQSVIMPEGSELDQECAACEKAFGEALDDDLNISAALAAGFTFIRDANKLLDNDEVSKGGAARADALLDRLDGVTGLFAGPKEEAPQAVRDLVNERQRARRAKDFARADAVRVQLAEQGWVIEDTPDGPRLKRKMEQGT